MVLNLQKQVQEKDDTLRDISEKLSHKSEECESLMEERDIMRSKNSFDLQQVWLNNVEVQILMAVLINSYTTNSANFHLILLHLYS